MSSSIERLADRLDVHRADLLTFARRLASGDLRLFTGAGFSCSAPAVDGQNLPLASDLRIPLWSLAFPGESADDSSSLPDIFQIALDRDAAAVRALFDRSLRADPRAVPEFYRIWFSAPWSRIYTINVDDLDEVVQVGAPLPVDITSISALSDDSPPLRAPLLSVHLNGRTADFPNVTFSSEQYGRRTASSAADIWMGKFVADFETAPFLFVGTQLDEPTFWHHLAVRGFRRSGARELRPKAYLVSPTLPVARAAVLKSLNIVHFRMGVREFAELVLADLSTEQELGRKALGGRNARNGAAAISVAPLASVRSGDSSADPADYLLGREPNWSDISAGFAVEREFEAGLLARARELDGGVLFITGTAGSGKSSTLMRLALSMDAEGRRVSVLTPNEISVGKLRRAVQSARPDVLVVDDVDVFGPSASTLLEGIAADSPETVVLAAARNSRLHEVGLFIRGSSRHGWPHVVMSPLSDRDIDLLLDSLERANRLGVLLGLPRTTQRERFRQSANRQLLVAMIEATSGRKFEEKIATECAQLSARSGFMYGLVAYATWLREHLLRPEILFAADDASNDGMERLQELIEAKLVLARDGELRLRHLVVAEEAVNYYRDEHQLSHILSRLLFVVAADNTPDAPIRDRRRRLLILLLGHDRLLTTLGDIEEVRATYAAVETLLKKDYHFWLQRGEAEVSSGEPDLAENFLNQARQLKPDDYMVQTAWAHMNFVRALADVTATDAASRVERAFRELDDVIAQHADAATPHTYHVYGSKGLEWGLNAPLSREERRVLIDRLRKVLEQGMLKNKDNPRLRLLSRELERHWLMTAVAE